MLKQRVVKFLTIGTSGAILNLTILFTCTEFIGLHYLLSYAISVTIVVTTNYILNSVWTFNDKKASFTGL
jgi:dolichol-phosphate mannosyltransferase